MGVNRWSYGGGGLQPIKNPKNRRFFASKFRKISQFRAKSLDKNLHFPYNSAVHKQNSTKGEKMNKSDFIEVVKKVGGYDTKKGAEQAISAFTDAVKQVLVKKDSVELVGFGKFETAVQAAKTGKIPGTKQTYTTKEKMVPKFKAGKALKDEVAKMKVTKK